MTYFACPDPAAFAPDRFPIWIWQDEPVLLRLPDVWRGRPEGRPGRAAAADHARDPHLRPGRGGVRAASTAFMERHLPGALAPPIYTRTCLYTLTPDRDFVVDRLPDAPGRRRRAGRSPRVQVRLGARPDRDRTARRRRHAIGRRARRIRHRSTRPGGRRADAQGGPRVAALPCVCKAPAALDPRG